MFSGQSARDAEDRALETGPEKARRRVMVIGLDCATPKLVFDRWLDDLPNLKSLCRSGLHGLLRSCDPPITVPAWSVMMSSKSPGRLGVYGFRNRADHSYDRYSIANSLAIKEDRLWDILSRSGKRSIVIGVPGTYPPSPLNGLMITDFLTPDTTCQYTHPPELKQEIERVVAGTCVNEWLIANGYLALAEKPARATPLSKVKIDWSRTKAWGDGGYYARVFLNVAGREPNGTIAPGDYEKVRDELSAGLKAIPGENGQEIGTQVFRPEELYKEVRGVAPDLIVYFGGLYWRSVGTVGGGKIHTFENDTGPDGANHAENGIFLFRPANGGLPGKRRIDGLRIIDIAPMILQLFGLSVPVDMEGQTLTPPNLS